MNTELNEFEKQVRQETIEAAERYFDALYKKQHDNKKYVQVLLKDKEGVEIGRLSRSEYSVPFTIEDIVLELNGELDTKTFFGGAEINRENLKSIEIILE